MPTITVDIVHRLSYPVVIFDLDDELHALKKAGFHGGNKPCNSYLSRVKTNGLNDTDCQTIFWPRGVYCVCSSLWLVCPQGPSVRKSLYSCSTAGFSCDLRTALPSSSA